MNASVSTLVSTTSVECANVKKSNTSAAPITVTSEFVDAMDVYRVPDKTRGLLANCADNVVLFAELMLGLRLYAWQVYFLNKLQMACHGQNSQREFMAMTSRQIGKSTAVAVFSVWACVFNKYPGTINKNTLIGITSASDVQAKKLLRDIKMLMHRGSIYMRDSYKDESGKPKFGEQFFGELLSADDPNNTSTITFRTYDVRIDKDLLLKGSLAGSVIKSYPPTPTLLGETFSIIIIDEAGRTESITDEFFKEIITPTGNSTNALRLYISTPWVNSGFFYELVDPHGTKTYGNRDLSVFTIDAIELENPAYYKTVMDQISYMNANGDIDEVQRAYYCRFVKGTKNYFDSDNVLKMFTYDLAKVDKFSESCDMGIDFGGQTTSQTVVTISRINADGIVERLYHRTYSVGKDTNLVDDIAPLLKLFNVQRIIPDDCLVAGTEVLMGDLSRKAIDKIVVGDKVMSFNFETQSYEPKDVTATNSRGVASTYTVSFRNGTSVQASPGHRWFVKDRRTNKLSVVKTVDLRPDKHYLPVALNVPSADFSPVSEAEAYLLGMYIAEGHKRPTKHAFFISQFKQETREKIKSMLSATSFKWQENKKGFYISKTNELESLFNRCGTSAYTKRIPQECFTWSKPLLSSLYSGLIDGDGCTQSDRKDKRGFSVSRTEAYYTVSRELNNDIRTLMLLLNKPSHYRTRVSSGFGSDKLQYSPVWVDGSTMNSGKLFIKSVVLANQEKTYDISVKDNHSFILTHSGVITHNCAQGDHMIRQMVDKGWNVQPVSDNGVRKRYGMNFKTDKVKKYSAFRSMLNRGLIRSYHDRELQTEMLALEQSERVRNSLIEPSPGYRDDHIDSFLLSTYFFLQEESGVKTYDW